MSIENGENGYVPEEVKKGYLCEPPYCEHGTDSAHWVDAENEKKNAGSNEVIASNEKENSDDFSDYKCFEKSYSDGKGFIIVGTERGNGMPTKILELDGASEFKIKEKSGESKGISVNETNLIKILETPMPIEDVKIIKHGTDSKEKDDLNQTNIFQPWYHLQMRIAGHVFETRLEKISDPDRVLNLIPEEHQKVIKDALVDFQESSEEFARREETRKQIKDKIENSKNYEDIKLRKEQLSKDISEINRLKGNITLMQNYFIDDKNTLFLPSYFQTNYQKTLYLSSSDGKKRFWNNGGDNQLGHWQCASDWKDEEDKAIAIEVLTKDQSKNVLKGMTDQFRDKNEQLTNGKSEYEKIIADEIADLSLEISPDAYKSYCFSIEYHKEEK